MSFGFDRAVYIYHSMYCLVDDLHLHALYGIWGSDMGTQAVDKGKWGLPGHCQWARPGASAGV